MRRDYWVYLETEEMLWWWMYSLGWSWWWFHGGMCCAQSCPAPCGPMDCSPPRPLYPWDFPVKNTGVGCHFLLQGIFPTWDQTCVSCIAGRFFPTAPPRKFIVILLLITELKNTKQDSLHWRPCLSHKCIFLMQLLRSVIEGRVQTGDFIRHFEPM